MIFLKRNLKYWKTLSKNALRALLPNEARKMGKRPEKQAKRMKRTWKTAAICCKNKESFACRKGNATK